MERCFAECRQVARARATEYRIEQVNWRKVRRDPKVVTIGVVAVFVVAMYLGVKHGALESPSQVLKQARRAVQELLQADSEAMVVANERSFERQLTALEDRLMAQGALNASLTLDQLRAIAEPILGVNGTLVAQAMFTSATTITSGTGW